MSWYSRRAILVLTAVVVLGGVSVIQHASAQLKAKRAPAFPPPPVPGGPGVPGAPAPPVKKEYDLGSLTLPKDDDLKDRIDAATDNIKRKDWERACKTLQELVGRSADVWVPLSRTDPTGREIQLYGSVKKEAARLIGSLPRAGREFYEATYGPKADAMVKRARLNNDRREMGQAMSLYLFTESGAEAANWLGTYHLDRAEFQAASRFFLQLINRAGVKLLKNRTLLKAAYAFHHAGDTRGKDLAFKELKQRDLEIKLRDEPRTVAELQEAIGKMVVSVSLQSASDSPIYRGRPSRNAMLPGGNAFLERAWKFDMARTNETKAQLKMAENAMLSRNLPILSTFFPVTATVTKGGKQIPLLIYRSYWGIHAANMKTGKEEWTSPSDWSVDRVLGAVGRDRDSGKVAAYQNWFGHFLTQNARPQIILENSVLGTLSADNKMIYAIEDLAVPPPPQVMMGNPGFGGINVAQPGLPEKVAQAVQHNKLQAFSLAKEGSLVWELGGIDKAPLADSFFLGAPLPLNGQLYVLTEKQQELRLVAIEPATGKVLSSQHLANTKDVKLSQDPLRRTQATHLAYGEGILVVPTNAGAVFGVDLLSNSLVWAYPYRESKGTPAPAAQPGMFRGRIPPGFMLAPNGTLIPIATTEAHWQVTAPIIQDGKVVFTAPDAHSIHCVSLRDGTRLWTHNRDDDDVFLAGVFNSKVVIVGKKRTRALTLARGEKMWELETGTPSGQGAAGAPTASGDVIYYLPIAKAANTGEPEICAINVDKGVVQAHTRSRKREVPGNLIFYEGNVLSQTHNEVVAYPQLEVKLREMDLLVQANPNNPTALTDRGDYLLDKGDLGGAIADFRKALKNKPPPATLDKARAKLYEAFTEYFQRDFNKAEEYLKEYEDLCKIDLTNKEGAERTALMAEERRRRANFLCLVGKGREAQNRLIEAFEKYLELGAEARKDELIQVVDEPSVKAAPDVWSQGRIAAMVQNAADAKQKKAIEDLIAGKWAKLKASKSVPMDDLRKFVSLFGSLFGVGKEARLTLAERLMEDTEVNSLLEAEQQLSLLRGEQEPPEVAARAIEALARLNTRKGLLEDAAFYYRLLGEKYPKVMVDGKRGEKYLEDLATDKRFLPYLDQAGPFTLRGPASLRYTEEKSKFDYTPHYQFAHSGEALPFFVRNRLSLQMDYNHQLKLHDSATGEELWKPGLSLTRTQFQQIATSNGQPNRVKFGYQTLGHLVVLQLGHMVYGVDPLNKGRVLWERNLSSLPNSATTAPAYQSLTVDPRDQSVVVAYSDGWMQRLGETGPLQGGVICLQMRDSLAAIDPVTGRTLWTRSDVSSRSHVFGDEQHIYVVNMGVKGDATGTRVFRAYDGVSVRSPDFSKTFDERVRLVGRNILATDVDLKGVRTLRIYDVLQGKDLWKQTFAPGTLLLQSEDPNLAGVIEANGTVRVMDVRTQKEVLNAKLADPKHVQGAQSVALVSDPDYLFVAVNGPMGPDVVPWGGGVQSNLMTGAGLRSIPVNGMLYSFPRKGGETWYCEVKNQHMVLSQFEDLPMVLFTSRYQKWIGNNPAARTAMNATEAKAIAKRNGKMWYNNDSVPMGMFFHGLTMDHRTGKVEFIGYQMKVTMTAVPK